MTPEFFYNQLRQQFPKIDKLKIWEEYAWQSNGFENAIIMDKLAEEMISWEDLQEIEKFLQFIETAIIEGDNILSSYVYTDFLVTIIGMDNKNKRELIKKMLKSESQKKYANLLNLYRE